MALIDDVISAIGTYRDEAVGALNDLGTWRPTHYSPTTLPAPALSAPGAVAPMTVGTLPTIPAVSEAQIEAAPTIGTVLDDTIQFQPFDAELPTIASTDFDSEIAIQMGAAASALQANLFTWLENEVQAIVATGGSNISAGVQNAVFNTGYERAMQTTRDALDLTGAKTGAKGFRYPNSMTKALQAEIALNFIWQRSDLSRSIMKEMADFAQRNLQAALSAGVSIDEAKARIFTETQNAVLAAQRVALEKYQAEIQGRIREFEGNLQITLANLGVQRANQEAQISVVNAQAQRLEVEGRLKLSAYDAQTRAALSKLDADKSAVELKGRMELAKFDADVRAKAMKVETDRMISELARSTNEQAIRLFSAQVQQEVEVQRAALSATQQENQLAVGVLENIAKTYVEMMNSLSGQGIAVDVTKH